MSGADRPQAAGFTRHDRKRLTKALAHARQSRFFRRLQAVFFVAEGTEAARRARRPAVAEAITDSAVAALLARDPRRGHGGNTLLRHREPRNFRFTILQRVSPDLDVGEVIRLESSWKHRLHTRVPYGLNDN